MTAKERFSISMDPAVRAALRERAEAMGLDVSAYITASVRRQLAEDALVAQRFAEVDAAIAATEAMRPPAGAEPLIDEAELEAARAGMARALAPSAEEAA
ncbi:hypothetical protein RKE29_04120 [Streptomyces sp. B1866]|uniref:hypothetical protein n=1 Tax=Streptomyces sp. B1866 TaxID=3075431 RepID=UPI00288D4C89|nr:hypothetical protein [Streptomyces sp. B1866]MDT3395837.1 hypothetical protein [Streptomyces sp. B1866]